MNENEAFALIKRVIEEKIFPGDEARISMDADLHDDLGLDSLDQLLLLLVMNLEKELRIVFAGDGIYQHLSIRDLVEWIVHCTAKCS